VMVPQYGADLIIQVPILKLLLLMLMPDLLIILAVLFPYHHTEHLLLMLEDPTLPGL
jgi:hypothetical protein